ncbi:hypothetical protein ACOMHN_026359 [Nucella lapillus]
MIFAARQTQEKCKEQNMDLYILFVDLTKAFDTVSRPGLWNILPRIGIPPKMVKIIKCFHDGMNARLVNSSEKDGFPVTNGVKQRCVVAPTLFSFLFSMMLLSAFKDSDPGIQITYRTDGGILNTQRLKAKTKHTACCRVVSCDVVSCDVVCCDVVSCDVVSCDVVSCDVMSCDVVSCDLVRCDVVSCDVVSCDVVSCDVVSCDLVSCDVVSCDVVSIDVVILDVVSCDVVSCDVVSCDVVSCDAVSCDA